MKSPSIPLAAQPGIQVLPRADVGVDHPFLEGTPVLAIGGPQIVFELRESGFPLAERRAFQNQIIIRHWLFSGRFGTRRPRVVVTVVMRGSPSVAGELDRFPSDEASGPAP